MARRNYPRLLGEVSGKRLTDDIKTVEKMRQRYEKRYAVKKRSSGNWIKIGAIQRTTRFDRGVRFSCERGQVELYWVAPDCIRLRFQASNDEFKMPFSYAIAKTEWPTVPFEFVEGAEAIEIRSSALVCRIGKKPFRMGVETLDSRLVCVDAAGMQFKEDGSVRLSMAMQADEASYGLGERASGLMLRGKRFLLWNAEPVTDARDEDRSYYSIPFYVGVHQNGVYGLFWDNASRGVVDTGASKREELAFEAEAGELRYYLFVGSDVRKILARYTELTGRIRLPPLWGLGYHHSRVSSEAPEHLLKLAQDFREHQIPCDALYLDLYPIEGFQPFTWDQLRFVQIGQLLESLRNNGFKTVASLHPGIKNDAQYPIFQSASYQDVFLKYPDGQAVIGTDWPGVCVFPDFTDPKTRSWWVEQVSNFASVGVDGLFNDMDEPSVLMNDGSGTLSDFVAHSRDGASRNHVETHNEYGMMMGAASHEGLARWQPQLRPFNLIRAGFAGAQRLSGSWMVETLADWDHLRMSISIALNMGLSGAPMTGPDVGSFQKEANPELFTRWLQAACLMPFFRSHTALGIPFQEPWSFGQPYEVINRVAIGLRYRLMPYLYSVVAQCKEYGWPIVQPVFMAEPGNPDIRAIDDCYMLGDALLIAPVVTPNAVRRMVYLPTGQWYDYWTGDMLEGGQSVTVAAPLERLPLFVRAGAALPHWTEMNYTGEREVDTLVYRVYPGSFETVQYEDRGEGLEYEQGDYRWIYMTSSWEDNRFLISRRIAGQYTPSYKNVKLEIYGFNEEPLRVRVDRQGAPLWFYDDGILELTIDSFRQIEIIGKPSPTDETLLRRPW